MNHDQVVERVGQLADGFGLLWCYWPNSVRVRGHRGAPDMLIAGPGGLALAEIKTGGPLESDQVTWRNVLLGSGTRWYLWQPAGLFDDSIARELASLAR